MRKTIFIILLVVHAGILYAQNSFWVKQVGGDSTIEQSRAIAVDNQGNIYYAGNFKVTVDFDPGPGVFNLSTHPLALYGGDPFVSKLDASGNFVWAKNFSGGHGKSYAVAVDDSGNVFTTGEFWGDSTDFDPGPGTFYMPFTGMGDCFICKLDKNGNFVWAQKYASPSPNTTETGYLINFDSAGNIYLAAGLYFSFQLDAVLLKLNPVGNIIWTKTINGNGNDRVGGLLPTNDGYLYINGSFESYVNLSPFSLTGSGYIDSYIAKLDTSGTILWVKQISGHYVVSASEMVLDNDLNIFISGSFQDTADFDPGPGVYNMTSVNNSYYDVFIEKFDSAGNFIWAKAFGGSGLDIGGSLMLDSAANVYSIGTFQDTVDFDPGVGNYLINTPNYNESFFSKLDSAGNFIWAKQMKAAASDGVADFAVDRAASIYSTGIFTSTTDFDLDTGTFNLNTSGVSDMFIHKFRQCTPSNGTDVITACDSLTWIDGNTYTTSTNTPVFTIIGGSATNCDSIVTLDLTITHSTSATDSITACKSFTWIDGNIYTSNNNTATHILANSVGCDSVVTLNLTINNANTSVSLDSTTAMLTADSGALSYQWLDCNSNYSEINGATSQSFAPLQNGYYAVAITQNGCTDTSACVAVLTVGIAGENTHGYFAIYPNPNKGIFSVGISNFPQSEKKIEIYNTYLQLIFSKIISGDKAVIDLSHQPDGIYIVIFKAKDESFSKKIILHNRIK